MLLLFALELIQFYLLFLLYAKLLKISFEKNAGGLIETSQKFFSRTLEDLKKLSILKNFQNTFDKIITAFDFQTKTSFFFKTFGC